jgi:hypothetical protein
MVLLESPICTEDYAKRKASSLSSYLRFVPESFILLHQYPEVHFIKVSQGKVPDLWHINLYFTLSNQCDCDRVD